MAQIWHLFWHSTWHFLAFYLALSLACVLIFFLILFLACMLTFFWHLFNRGIQIDLVSILGDQTHQPQRTDVIWAANLISTPSDICILRRRLAENKDSSFQLEWKDRTSQDSKIKLLEPVQIFNMDLEKPQPPQTVHLLLVTFAPPGLCLNSNQVWLIHHACWSSAFPCATYTSWRTLPLAKPEYCLPPTPKCTSKQISKSLLSSYQQPNRLSQLSCDTLTLKHEAYHRQTIAQGKCQGSKKKVPTYMRSAAATSR